MLLIATVGLLACGDEGNRAPACGQEGAVCEVQATDTDVGGGTATAGPGGSGDSQGEPDTTGGPTSGEVDASGGVQDSTGGPDAGTDSGGGTTGVVDGTTGGTDGTDGTTGGWGVEPVDPPAGFVTPQTFGDSVLELDLIGTWTLPTDGAPVGYSMAVEVTAEGRIHWREYDDVCDLSQYGSGWIWVEGSQIVMLFGLWHGPAPWPVQQKYGWDADAPFLIRSGYAPVLGHVGMTLPPAIREAQPWAGRGYARTIGGATAQDLWVAETELWALAPGADQADIVVRDRTALDMTQPSVGNVTFRRWWFQDGQIDPELPVTGQVAYVDAGAGNVTIAGSAHKYLGNRMTSYAPGDNFLINGQILCE